MVNNVQIIHTKQLLLRTLEEKDAHALQSLLARNKEHMLPWIPWAKDEPETIVQKREKIRIWKAEFFKDQKYVYSVFDINNKLVGLIFLFTRQGPGILEIGYIIDKEEGGRGYATEASYALTKLALIFLQTAKAVMHINVKNTVSMRIPQKLGFNLETIQKFQNNHAEGQGQQQIIWSMSHKEFKPLAGYEPVSFVMEDGGQKP